MIVVWFCTSIKPRLEWLWLCHLEKIKHCEKINTIIQHNRTWAVYRLWALLRPSQSRNSTMTQLLHWVSHFTTRTFFRKEILQHDTYAVYLYIQLISLLSSCFPVTHPILNLSTSSSSSVSAVSCLSSWGVTTAPGIWRSQRHPSASCYRVTRWTPAACQSFCKHL